MEIELVGPNGQPLKPRASNGGDIFVARRIPDFAEAVLKGKIWKVQDLTTTAVLNDVLPTTVSGLTVQNPTTDKYYVVYVATGIADVSPASLGSISLSHAAHKATIALLTRDVALTTVGGYKPGQGAYNGEIVLDRGATVVDDGWTPLGNMVSNVAASQTWMTLYVPIYPQVIIPPLKHWSLGATGNDATFEVGLGLVWGEFDLAELQ